MSDGNEVTVEELQTQLAEANTKITDATGQITAMQAKNDDC